MVIDHHSLRGCHFHEYTLFPRKSQPQGICHLRQIRKHRLPSHLLLALLLSTAGVLDWQKCSTQLTSVHDVLLHPVLVDAIQHSLSSLRSQSRLLGMLVAQLMTKSHSLPGLLRVTLRQLSNISMEAVATMPRQSLV
jgi:hypothetical protein